VCGGAGAGLVFVTTVCVPERRSARAAGARLALVALGLFAVWLELGGRCARPTCCCT
jgi:hypothetical protein